jgi:hypothetical protein
MTIDLVVANDTNYVVCRDKMEEMGSGKFLGSQSASDGTGICHIGMWVYGSQLQDLDVHGSPSMFTTPTMFRYIGVRVYLSMILAVVRHILIHRQRG